MNRCLIALCVVLVGSCDRHDAASHADAPTPGAGATKVDPNGPADPDYVDALMKRTAFDFGRCDDPVRLNGVAGSAPGGVPAVMVAVDSSGSMAARTPVGGTRMDEAARAVGSFAASLPPGTPVGLAAFGQAGSNRDADKARSCAAPPAVLAPLAANGGGSLGIAAKRLKPAGWTPLAEAIGSLSRTVGAHGVLYIVSDGVETCGGDPVAAARTANADASVIVNIIGFDIGDRAEERALRAVAAAGGGRYVAATAGALDDALRTAASRAMTANAVETGAGMQRRLTCYYDHMGSQNAATGQAINADRQDGRMSSATASAAFAAQRARYADASNRLARGHERMADRRDAANARILANVSDVR